MMICRINIFKSIYEKGCFLVNIAKLLANSADNDEMAPCLQILLQTSVVLKGANAYDVAHGSGVHKRNVKRRYFTDTCKLPKLGKMVKTISNQ